MIYGIGSAFMRSMTFLLLPFYTNELENYGEFVLVMTTIAFLRICYSHGIGDGFLKLYSKISVKKTNLHVETLILHIQVSRHMSKNNKDYSEMVLCLMIQNF